MYVHLLEWIYVYRTPTYYNQKIQESVTVQLILFSKGLDYRVSKPKTFTYLPIIGGNFVFIDLFKSNIQENAF